jgi:hypothetical protein
MAHTIDAVRTRRSAYRRRHARQRVETLEQFFTHNRRRLTQTFVIDPLRETVIRGKNGLSFRIPALAFEDQWGDPVLGAIQVEIIELVRKSDIVLADRATTSGNQLLETGGAFYFGGRQNNRPLRLGAPVQASVPISNQVDHPAYMQIFGGQNRGGAFDWRLDRVRKDNLRIDTTSQTFEVTIEQPGWINCDHYYRLRRQQHYYLQIEPARYLPEQEVFLIYRTINTVAKLRPNDQGIFTFPTPLPLPAVVYSIGAADGAFYQGFRTILKDPYEAGRQQEPQLLKLEAPMSPVLKEEIQTNLEEQIRFWDRETTKRVQERFGWMRRRSARR